MVIRRIREHVSAHNWFAVGVDFLIVVAGIVIGTQVNNWNQARLERNQGAEYRERMIAELRSNDELNQNRREYWTRVREHAQAALNELERPSGGGSSFIIDAYQASQILTGQSMRFTYDELVSTGRLEHIGEAPLRTEVAGFYLSLQAYDVILNAVPAYREHLRQNMPSAAQQAVRTQCAEAIYPGPGGSPFVRLPRRCSLKIEPAAAANASAAVKAAPDTVEHLNRLIADLDVKLTVLAAMDNHSRRLRAEIGKVEG